MNKPLLPLQLSAKRISWRVADKHASEHDEAFREVREQVLERDDYTCRYCGFKVTPTKTGGSYQEVHHVDDDHSNNSPENLMTACCLCHQVFHIGLAGAHNGGVIVYLPELTQAEIHHLCRSIFVAISTGSEYSDNARSLFAAMESRSMHVEEHIGSGASNPGYLGQAFMMMPKEQYVARDQSLAGLRMLPYPERFSEQIRFWIEHVYKDMHPDSWSQVLGSFVDLDVFKKAKPELEEAAPPAEEPSSEGVTNEDGASDELLAQFDGDMSDIFPAAEEIQFSQPHDSEDDEES